MANFRPHKRKTIDKVEKVLLACCNDQALRVIGDCAEDGIVSVAAYCEEDADHECVARADESVCIGAGRDSGCYADHYAILSAAEQRRANAIFLCEGPLSGDEDFARTATAAGFLVLDTAKAEEK